jgi:hypothetical protein
VAWALACTPARHPAPIEEVPIASAPTQTIADRTVSQGSPSVDAAVVDAATVPAEGGDDQAPDADVAGSRKRATSPRSGKAPVAINGTSSAASGGSGGEGESERSRLEAKVARGEATPEEARALLRLCAKQHDQACMKRATAALRAQPH